MTATDDTAAEQIYRQAIAALSEGVVVQDKRGSITSCNPAAERILGLTAEQMRGRTSVDPRWRAVHEDGSSFLGAEHPAMVTLRTGTPLRGVIMGVHKPDGSLSWISINSMPFRAGSDGVGEDAVVTTFVDITARRAAEARLRESEERFQTAIGSMRDAVAILSPVCDEADEIVDFRYDYANDAHCELVGRERERLLTRCLGEVFCGWLQSERFEVYRQVMLTGTPFRSEDFHPEPAWGTEFARRALDSVVARAGGRLVVSARDVSDRRRIEAQLAASEERFDAAVGSMLDSLVIFSPVHDDHGEIVDFCYEYANDAYCVLVERDRDQLLGRAVGELFASFRGERLEFYRQVAVSGEPVRSELLGVQGVWAGTVLADRAFDVMVAPMGESLVVSYRDVTDRWNAQQAHAAAEARFHDVIESAPDAMVIVNADGAIQLVNAQTETLFGYAREELVGQTHEVLVPELLLARHNEQRASDAGNPRAPQMGAGFELFARRKDGSEFPVEVSLSALGAEHETLICGAIRDVTARRQAEQELALRAELLDLAHDAVIVREPSEDRVSFWNREAQAVYDYSAAEAIGRVTHELLATVFPDSKEAVDEALARDGQWSGELRHVRKDGREILVSSRQALQRDPDGHALAIIELNSDITAQRQAEHDLRDSRAQLAEAERVAGIGSWQWDLTNNQMICSAGLLDIYGLTADEFAAGFEGVNQRVYPDDRELVSRIIQRAVAERSSFTTDYRVIRSDGRVRTVRSHGEIVVDETGQLSRAIGIVQDITEAKLAHEALQSTSVELERRAAELHQLALSTAHEPPATAHAPLTARQLEILQLIAQGLTNAAIAERLFLTEGTVKWHVSQILTKTNTSNRVEAIARVLGTPP